MTGSLTSLGLAVAYFLGIHFLVSGTALRGAIVALTGERAFAGLFSLAAAFGLGWIGWAYHDAPVVGLWHAAWLPWIPILVMPFALILVVSGVTTSNATSVFGIARITRHPLMWGVSLWAGAHLIANGDVASVLMFGGLLSLALFGPLLIDAKQRRRLGEAWPPLAGETSWLPFAAALAGRTKMSLREIGWWRPGLGLAVYVIAMGAHRLVFGVAPWAT